MVAESGRKRVAETETAMQWRSSPTESLQQENGK